MWVHDPEFDKIMAEQRKIDSKMWRSRTGSPMPCEAIQRGIF
jgi:hypothetical protein